MKNDQQQSNSFNFTNEIFMKQKWQKKKKKNIEIKGFKTILKYRIVVLIKLMNVHVAICM